MRNKIAFSGHPNYNICNPNLVNILQQFAIFFDQRLHLVINITNQLDIGLEAFGNVTIELVNFIMTLPNLKYGKVNDTIIKNEMMSEQIVVHNQSNLITRTFKTFHQNDDYLRDRVHHYFSSLSAKLVLCIGGECYLYPLIVKKVEDYYLYTDSSDIYQTCIANHPNKKEQCYLVDYNQFELVKYRFDMVIFNVSIKGMTPYMVNLLISNNITDNIYIVSCCQSSFERDCRSLKTKYQINQSISLIHPNYPVSINIYHLITQPISI